MTIPEDVRDIIRTTLEYYVEYWDENDTSMDNRYSTDAHADAEIVYAWLDAQPDAPIPNWDNAPEDATHHAFLHDGRGAWLLLNPGDGYDSPGMWEARMMRFSGLRLPLGVDWRTTLRERPEA